MGEKFTRVSTSFEWMAKEIEKSFAKGPEPLVQIAEEMASDPEIIALVQNIGMDQIIKNVTKVLGQMEQRRFLRENHPAGEA